MVVRRIVSNIKTEEVERVSDFYRNLFGLETVMDQGWIATLASDEQARVQVSIAKEGGSGTPVPDISIEVDDIDIIYEKAEKLKLPIEYGPVDEPWGVRRFYLRDPAGKLLNILAHI